MYSGLSHEFILRMLDMLDKYAVAVGALDEEQGATMEKIIIGIAYSEGILGDRAKMH